MRLGRRKDVAQVLAALDVLTLPSLGEGFPNALAEGLACGVPAACLDVGAARAITGPGGVVAAAGACAPDTRAEVRAEALAECVTRLLTLSPAQRAELGAKGRAHVLEHYGLDAAVERWVTYLKSLAAGA